MNQGLLLAVPLDSVFIRVAVAVIVGAVVGHLLYRASLMSVRARFAAAFIPVVALIATVLVSLRSPWMPVLMVPTTSGAVLPIPVEYGYLDFAPLAVPLLFGAWAIGAIGLLTHRFLGYLSFARLKRVLLAQPVPVELQLLVTQTASRMGIPAPQVGLAQQCRGGAYVAGLRRPFLVISEVLYASLDAEEREGMVAHELAHIARRDLLSSFAVGIVRDLLFFVPGRAWAERSLRRERERAADAHAVTVTSKPAALASSMLKACDLGTPSLPKTVVALAPQGEFVSRVEALLHPRPVSTLRHRLELLAVAAMSVITVVFAVTFPNLIRTEGADRDGVALMWSNGPASMQSTQVEARVFSSYRTIGAEAATMTPQPVRTHIERQLDNRPSTVLSCFDSLCPSPATAVSLGLAPRRTTSTPGPHEVLRATPVRDDPSSNLRLFWVADSNR